jgi:hypothetical protein
MAGMTKIHGTNIGRTMIEEYDEWRDTIITSEDFQNCKHKDDEDRCLLEKDNPKCWFVDECPDGKDRR